MIKKNVEKGVNTLLGLLFLLSTTGCIQSTFSYNADLYTNNKKKASYLEASVPISTAGYSFCILFWPSCFAAAYMPYEGQVIEIENKVLNTLEEKYPKRKFRLRNYRSQLKTYDRGQYKISIESPNRRKKVIFNDKFQYRFSINFDFIFSIGGYFASDASLGYFLNDGFEMRGGQLNDNSKIKMKYLEGRTYPFYYLAGSAPILDGFYIGVKSGLLTTDGGDSEDFGVSVSSGYRTDSGLGLQFFEELVVSKTQEYLLPKITLSLRF